MYRYSTEKLTYYDDNIMLAIFQIVHNNASVNVICWADPSIVLKFVSHTQHRTQCR